MKLDTLIQKFSFQLILTGIVFTLILISGCASSPKTKDASLVAAVPQSGTETVDRSKVEADDKTTPPAKSATRDTEKKLEIAEEKIVPGAAPMPADKETFRESADIAGKSSFRPQPSESGLKAGYSDDNDQFNYFIKFLAQFKTDASAFPLNIEERIILNVRDSSGKPVNNAEISVQVGGKTISTGKTYASGIFYLFPLEYPDSAEYGIQVVYGQEKKTIIVERMGPRNIEIKLGITRKVQKEIPLDLLFILDTTGSMGEEIERLRSTIEIINANISSVTPKPLVRFALVLYRDVDDDYVTSVVPFTSDLDAFQKTLDTVHADGGGDSPEDLQSALAEAMKSLNWNKDGIRLAYTVTDAPPHLDYEQEYTYADAAREAKAKGIKLFSVGTGGLPLQGEYVLRQISQYTAARYIFLTYGEKGESEGGKEASVSHHTGSNFQTDKLEAIIIRFTREEMANLNDSPVVINEPYFDARKIDNEKREETLSKLFQDALNNLIDYSTYSIGPKTEAAFLDIVPNETENTGDLMKQAEYFTEALLLSALRAKPFVVVERKDLQKILAEQKLQYSGEIDDASAVRLGSFLGAEVLLSGKLYVKDGKYEIFLKLLRVETGEILSVTRAKLTKDLGL